MELNTVVDLTKERLGIRSIARDPYISDLVQSVLDELDKQQELELDPTDMSHAMFCADYAAWRYQSRDKEGSMPRHLKFRLHNLILSTRRQA